VAGIGPAAITQRKITMYTHKTAAPAMMRDYLELQGSQEQQQDSETWAETAAAAAGFILCMALVSGLLFIG